MWKKQSVMAKGKGKQRDAAGKQGDVSPNAGANKGNEGKIKVASGVKGKVQHTGKKAKTKKVASSTKPTPSPATSATWMWVAFSVVVVVCAMAAIPLYVDLNPHAPSPITLSGTTSPSPAPAPSPSPSKPTASVTPASMGPSKSTTNSPPQDQSDPMEELVGEGDDTIPGCPVGFASAFKELMEPQLREQYSLNEAAVFSTKLDGLRYRFNLTECESETAYVYWSSLADQMHFMHKYYDAIYARTSALGILSRGTANMSTLLSEYVGLVDDLRMSLDFESALSTLDSILERLAIPEEPRTVLMRMKASIQDCRGDSFTAIETFEQALAAVKNPNILLAREHYVLLRHVQAMGTLAERPTAILKEKVAAVAAAMVRNGVTTNPQQMPLRFFKGLEAKPFHNVDDHPAVKRASAILSANRNGLVEELRNLTVSKYLANATECLQFPMGGEWKKYEINGYWHRRDENDCSLHTPVACAVKRELEEAGLPVIRAGYSVVGPQGWIRPHFGQTNAQLKLHLGLTIPESDGEHPCARIRVGTMLKTWYPGKVLFFDDSFDHEVWNDCTATRSIFQVAFVHHDAIRLFKEKKPEATTADVIEGLFGQRAGLE
eukprot:m.246735 g.246735  ORF g.246735 m.246735 type:complete len:605 (+) comp15385_c0_seq1:59-1873(+)